MRLRIFMLCVVVISALAASPLVECQVAIGVYGLSTFDNKGFDVINLGSLNSHFEIPVFLKRGRAGLNFSHSLVYDSSFWTPVGATGYRTWQPAALWGWQGDTQALTGNLAFDSFPDRCFDDPDDYPSGYSAPTDENFVYTDPSGQTHTFGVTEVTTCSETGGDIINSGSVYADDGSGMQLVADGYGSYHILLPNGSIVYPTYNGAGGSSKSDSNGNSITFSGTAYTDTTGTAVLTLSGSGNSTSPRVLTYPTYLSTGSSTAAVTVYYSTHTVRSAFGCSGISEYNASGVNLVDHIHLADGETYYFTYETTPGFSGDVTGRISTITLPTGGRIAYTYTGGSNGIVCADGSTAGVTRVLSDDPAGSTWTYTRTPSSTTSNTIVVDGFGNHSSYDFTTSTGADVMQAQYYETNRVNYEGAATGTPMLSRQTCYNGSSPSCTTSSIGWPITQVDTYETLDGLKQHGTTVKYDASGDLTESDYYDFGSASSRGSLLRYETLAYIVPGLVSVDTIWDGSGDTLSQVSYQYDFGTLISTSGIPQHAAVSGPRDNVTSITQSGVETRVTSYTYDDTGTVRSVQSNPDSATTIQYDSGTNTFPTQVNHPDTTAGGSTVHHIEHASFDVSSGVEKTTTDQNGNVTNYYYDSLLRPTLVQYPLVSGATVHAQTSYIYTPASSGPFHGATIEKDVARVSGSNITTTATLDNYGRQATATSTDSSGNVSVDTTFDANGQIYTVTNPHRSTSGSTDGISTYSYDVLGRETSVAIKDGSGTTLSTSTSVRAGNVILLADGAGNQRKLISDGLGRTITVLEPDSVGAFSYETDYLYEQNYSSSLYTYQTIINQKGGSGSSSDWHTRTFTYDLLGRIVSELTPESGTIMYAYTNSGTPCSGNPSAVCLRTDNIPTTTTYTYDGLDRLTGKTYSGTGAGTTVASHTSSVTYYYDQSSYNGLTAITNGIGNLTGMSDNAGAGVTAWQYDTLNRPTDIRKTINGHTLQSTIIYNLDSSVYKLTDFGNTILTYSYDNTGRPTSVVDAAGNSYASSATYYPASLLSSVSHQMSGGATYSRSNQYNPMLQPTVMSANRTSSPSATLMSYSIGYGTAGYDNGNISAVTDNVNAGWNQTFTYDKLNRLQTATNPDATHGNDWVQSFTIDPWGNITAKSQTGTILGTNPSSTQTGNRLAALGYDGAGRVTSAGINSYSYDAEGRIYTANSNAYIYDGMGNRVEKTVSGTSTLYWPGISGQIIDESNSSATTIAKQVFFGGVQVWRESAAGGSGIFLFQDHLGSTKVTADASGSVKDNVSYYPYSEHIPYSSSSTTTDNHYGYAGYEEDGDSDYAVNRNLNPTWGRFNRPDPYLGSYDVTNPQTLNRYGYVLNRPLIMVDSLGLNGDLAGKDFWDNQDCMRSGDDESIIYCDDNGLKPDSDGPLGDDAGDGVASGGGANSNAPKACAGRTFPLSADISLQANANGTFTAIGINLGNTPSSGTISGNAISVPANTKIGIGSDATGSITVTLTNPMTIAPIGSWGTAKITSLSFSNGQFTSVNGAEALSGIPFGSTYKPSNTLKNLLNQNPSAVAAMQGLVKTVNLLQGLINCSVLTGG